MRVFFSKRERKARAGGGCGGARISARHRGHARPPADETLYSLQKVRLGSIHKILSPSMTFLFFLTQLNAATPQPVGSPLGADGKAEGFANGVT